jgi:PAS domain S-box-containing protein
MEHTILIVEDSRTQAEHLGLLLQGEGYRVERVTNGREALERISVSPPDLVISDVVMPEMDGYDLCRAVKTSRRTKAIPFVLLTSRAAPADIIKGLEHGADNFIAKPFEDEYLLERLRRILEHLDFRRKGTLEVQVNLKVGERELAVSADKQQIFELLFSTFEDLAALNTRLEASQRQIEEHARTLEARVEERTRDLAHLFNSVPIGLGRIMPDGTIVDANPALVRMLGYPDRRALLSTNACDICANPTDYLVWADRLEREETIVGDPRQFRRRDGAVIWLSRSARVLRDSAGRAVSYEIAVEDITERRRVEEELARQRAAAVQNEKLAAMGQLLAGVAHELNNPLAVVIGQAHLLAAALGPTPQADRVKKIVDAAQRCGRIVRNFLALARQHPPERQPTRLNDVVREAVELLAYSLRVDTVEVALELADDLPTLWADPHQLHQVVVNLVTNAHHAVRTSAGARRITLATRHDHAAGRVVLVVADTGHGIAAENLSRIFEPFFTTKPLGEGTGLGLAMLNGIVEEHGGSIGVESEPGRGTSFTVGIPVVVAPETVPGRDERPTPRIVPGARMLVADDEPSITSMLAEIFEPVGFKVDAVSDGRAALEKLDAGTYDFMICDLRMPRLDGRHVYREVERRHPHMARRLLFLTGDALSGDLRDFLEQVGVPAVSKPFLPDDVLRAVANQLGGEGPR